jgi:hypothetical protein
MKNFYFLRVIICGLIAGFPVHAAEKKDGPYNLEDLCDACFYKEAEDVERVLQNFEGDVNGVSTRNRPGKRIGLVGIGMYPTIPLAYTAARGNFDAMVLLLEHGATLTAMILHVLSLIITGEKFDQCFKFLREQKIDLDAPFDEFENRALHNSLLINIEKLVRAGSDIRVRNHAGSTPLYKFFVHRKKDIKVSGEPVLKLIKQLLKYGAPIDEYYKAGECVGDRSFIRETPCFAWSRKCIDDGQKDTLLLTRGEMCKEPSPRIDSLLVLSFKALSEKACTVIQDTKLAGSINPCLEKYVAWLGGKKVFEAEKYIQCHCPKIEPKPKSMVGFMKLVTLYAETEAKYKAEDRLKCYWGERWNTFTADIKKYHIEGIFYWRKVYLEKRLSKAVGQKNLYDKQHQAEQDERKALGKKIFFYN